MKDITVLMTGAGAPGAPGILSCYHNNGERSTKVVGVDMRERIPTRLQLDAFEQVPSAGSDEFIQTILDIAVKHHVDVIQPLVTRELAFFAAAAGQFAERGIKVCVSPLEQLQVANDKGRLLSALRAAGVPVPDFTIIHDAAEFRGACEGLGYPHHEVCFKPTVANGSRGFRVLSDQKDRGKLLFEEKPNSTYMRMEEAEEILFLMKKIPELLVMEYLPGSEYSVDLLVDHGSVRYCIPRLRSAMNGGISTRCIIENNREVIDYSTKVASMLGLHGNIGIQVRYSRAGEVKILEINPRVQGTIVACAAAGVNLPYFAIKQALGETVPQVAVDWGVEMLRHWKEVYYDAAGHAFTF